jgi:hypothetical protein
VIEVKVVNPKLDSTYLLSKEALYSDIACDQNKDAMLGPIYLVVNYLDTTNVKRNSTDSFRI